MDGRNDARQLQTVDLAALQLFVQQLGRFGHAEVQRFIVDIFHDGRYAFPGRLVSDTAAHNARAQYGCLFRRLNIFGQLFGFTFYILIVEEDTDQRTSFIGMRQRNKAFIFQIQRFFTTKTRGGFNGFHCGHRRRIMFTRRLCDHAFSDGKAHRCFNLTEFQRLQFRLAFSSPVEIAGNGLA